MMHIGMNNIAYEMGCHIASMLPSMIPCEGWHAWNIGCMWNIAIDMQLECVVGKAIYWGVGLGFRVLGGSSTNQCYTWVSWKWQIPPQLPFILCTLDIVGCLGLNLCCNFWINKFCNLQKCLVIHHKYSCIGTYVSDGFRSWRTLGQCKYILNVHKDYCILTTRSIVCV